MSKACQKVERKILSFLHGHKTRTQLPQIHAHLIRHGLHQSNLILAHFVSVCGSLNKMDHASSVFYTTQNPNILLFNSMIKGYSLNGPFEESLHLFSCMKNRDIWPDEYTLAPLLKSCSYVSDARLGQCVHGEVVRNGFQGFCSIRIGVVEFYTTHCGKMDDAVKMFDEMRDRDVVVWNLMVNGFCKNGNVDMGLCFFRNMTERSVVSWNSMIYCLARSRRDGEALSLFHEMRDHGLEPDEATLVTILPVCARLGAVEVGQWIHSYTESTPLSKSVISVRNALIDFHSKTGDLETATGLFDGMNQKNVVSWNSMISGLAFHGKGKQGVELFNQMIENNATPNDATFVSVLTCCAHAGLIEKARALFAAMKEDHNIEPKLEHYGCMVDLLGRNGRVREAYDLLKSMPIMPSAALWGALLSSCRTHGDVELAELSVKEVISLEPWNSGNYVLLSNIYAEDGRWDEVEKVRVLMRENSVKKAMGQSIVGTRKYGQW